jgi:hypothetical protein
LLKKNGVCVKRCSNAFFLLESAFLGADRFTRCLLRLLSRRAKLPSTTLEVDPSIVTIGGQRDEIPETKCVCHLWSLLGLGNGGWTQVARVAFGPA